MRALCFAPPSRSGFTTGSHAFDVARHLWLPKRTGIKFNLMVSTDRGPTLTWRVDQRIGRNKMYDRENETSPGILPIVMLIAAVIGTAGILLNDFGNTSQGSGNPEKITAAAVSRVGAIEIPSDAPAGQHQRGVSS